MGGSGREGRENDLAEYYDNEVHVRAARELPPERVRRRASFINLLAHEKRSSILEIGAGPGRDAVAFTAAGLGYTGVDLAPESVALCRSLGLDARVASVLDLPFADASFDAGWTMSTLLHIANDDLDAALGEVVRVLVTGAPFAVGLWGDHAGSEGRVQDGKGIGPPRFFSIRTDEVTRAALSRHGTIEEWVTWPGQDAWHYQWAVVRTPA